MSSEMTITPFIPVAVPRLGWSMEQGIFTGWLKQDGDPIKAGDAIFSLEGEKAVQEIESLDAGTLRMLPEGPSPGDTVLVGQVIAHLMVEEGTPGLSTPSLSPPSVQGDKPLPATITPASAADVSNRILQQQLPVDTSPEQPRATPRARRVARENGCDLTTIVGTGRGGRIRERDVLAVGAISFTTATDNGSSTTTCSSIAPAIGSGQIQPLSAVRKTIAARMKAAAQQAPMVTLTTRADATHLVSLRNQFRAAAANDGGDTSAAAQSIVPDYTAFIIKLAAAALAQHRAMTAQWRDEGLYFPEGMHIAVAVDTDAGVMAPVLCDVDRLTLRQIAQQCHELASAARTGKVALDRMQGGVFSISNLGMYGIDAFTPLVILPQSSTLGLGRIVREPAVVGDQIVPRDQMTLSLTFDHRVVDGAPAARFLKTLREAIENPGPWLMP